MNPPKPLQPTEPEIFSFFPAEMDRFHPGEQLATSVARVSQYLAAAIMANGGALVLPRETLREAGAKIEQFGEAGLKLRIRYLQNPESTVLELAE